MAAADVAMWLAIATRIGTVENCVTIEMKTNFVAAGRAGFLCNARVLKLGKRVVFGVAECNDTDGKLLAHHSITYIRP
jgi:acyl-coenzyme A thioesterase PaaI-like protein